MLSPHLLANILRTENRCKKSRRIKPILKQGYQGVVDKNKCSGGMFVDWAQRTNFRVYNSLLNTHWEIQGTFQCIKHFFSSNVLVRFCTSRLQMLSSKNFLKSDPIFLCFFFTDVFNHFFYMNGFFNIDRLS